jgi:PAS domain S-box-containing protein
MGPRSDVGEETGIESVGEATGPSGEAFWNLARESPSMLFLIADGKVVDANRRGEEALGIGREEASSRGFEVFRRIAVAPEYLDLSQEAFRRSSQGEEVLPACCALLTRDGRRIEGVLMSVVIELRGSRELVFVAGASRELGVRH